MLEPFVRVGKPVIATEFEIRTYRGAESSGTLGFGVTDTTRLYLHTRPVIGRCFRPRLNGIYERDEATRARSSGESLDELGGVGFASALIATRSTPQYVTNDNHATTSTWIR